VGAPMPVAEFEAWVRTRAERNPDLFG
jgi:hypothetical protein